MLRLCYKIIWDGIKGRTLCKSAARKKSSAENDTEEIITFCLDIWYECVYIYLVQNKQNNLICLHAEWLTVEISLVFVIMDRTNKVDQLHTEYGLSPTDDVVVSYSEWERSEWN